jgi:serine/threonine protein kinase
MHATMVGTSYWVVHEAVKQEKCGAKVDIWLLGVMAIEIEPHYMDEELLKMLESLSRELVGRIR